MIRLPTFSALPRAFKCRLSCALPRVDRESEDATAGTARHKFVERITGLVNGTPPVPLDEAREIALSEADEADREFLAALPVDRIEFEGVASEVAFAYDVETREAREIGRGLGRNYGEVKETEIVGTTDRFALLGEDAAYIGDYKGRSHRTPAREDPQLLAAALCGAIVYGRTRATLEVVRLVDGEVYCSKDDISAYDLDLFEMELETLAQRIWKDRAELACNGTLPPATEGPWCRYCASFPYCPAKWALARAVTGEEMLSVREVGAAYITPESAPRLYDLVREAGGILEAVSDALKDYARQNGGIELSDGRIYGVPPDAEKLEIVDGYKGVEAIAGLFGLPAAKQGAIVKLSESGVERAARAWLSEQPKDVNRRGALKEQTEKAIQLLKTQGLARVVRGGQLRAFRPGKEG